MAHDGQAGVAGAAAGPLEGGRGLAAEALAEARGVLDAGRARLAGALRGEGGIATEALEREQRAAHALAWIATLIEGLGALQDWAERLAAARRFGATEALLHQIAFGECLAQIGGGIPMSQGEMARPSDLGLDAPAWGPAARRLILSGNSPAARAALVLAMREAAGGATVGASGLEDELELVRAQFRRFAEARVIPHAQGWHLADRLIPAEVIAEMAALGVFGLTIPEAHGGLGLSKTAMCVVSEELSRGYIGVGSLATRTEIAAELILGGGTPEQKAAWLPRLATGEVLPTAVFTEPDTGSDLGSLRTRAVREGEDWVIAGNKSWITHAARADLMMVLARTEPASGDWRGLSMFLAAKTPGNDADPFPDAGLSGGEIGVLGYRGMKEYEIAFDGFRVPGANLLGAVTGQGFKQLMATFESARIQTAARAIGVAQAAMEHALRYGEQRRQFGRPIVAFPRVADKLAMMAVEIVLARQLTYAAARAKDAGRRCDLEAGMAKLLAARVAWAAADNAVQIHGGNGFALEYPVSRILCDARVLSIFEGAAEIQAQVIARRLLE